MKKSFSLILAFGWSISLLTAQSDRMVHSFGYFTEQFLSIDPEDLQMRPFYAFNYSTYYFLFQKNDIISVGVMGGLSFAVRPYGSPIKANLTSDWMVQIPAYVMARVGAQSTPYSEYFLGLGIGVGGSFTSAHYFETYQNYYTARYNLNRVDPQVVAELTLGIGGSPIALRAHLTPLLTTSNASLKAYNSISSAESLRIPAAIANFGVGLVYGF